MSSRRILFSSFLVGALTVNTAWAEPPAVKDGPLGMKFVRLPKGAFYMGWDGAVKGKKTEIKDDFEIATCTVTQGQWQALMGNNPSWFSRDGGGKDRIKDVSDADLKRFPVENVSWDDAQDFIKKLNEKERDSGCRYRLPTGAEWEYACRGGAASEEECSYHFYFGKPTNDLSADQANFDGNRPFGNAPKGKSLGRPAKVGSYKPNKLGLYDMHGNVWQWRQDLDGFGKGSGRVFRGGSWPDSGAYCRASYRGRFRPTYRDNYLGFRIARVRSAGKQGECGFISFMIPPDNPRKFVDVGVAGCGFVQRPSMPPQDGPRTFFDFSATALRAVVWARRCLPWTGTMWRLSITSEHSRTATVCHHSRPTGSASWWPSCW